MVLIILNNMQIYVNWYKINQFPFYWRLKGGDSFKGNIHYFHIGKLSIVISTIKKQDLYNV